MATGTDQRLAIAIDAINNASAVLNQVKTDLTGLGNTADVTDEKVGNLSEGLSSLGANLTKIGE